MKKILITSVVVLLIFIIYLTTLDKKIYYLTLGDELSISTDEVVSYSESISKYLDENKKLEAFVDEFSENNYHITDIINDIKDNRKVKHENKDISIKNALIKADLLTISVGMNDIASKINIKNLNLSNDYSFLYNDIDVIINDLEELLTLVRQYCKEDIVLVGLYYPFSVQNQELVNIFLYGNAKFKEISDKYNVKYIDIYNIFLEDEKNLSSPSTLYPSQIGYETIAEQIVVTINNTVLKK